MHRKPIRDGGVGAIVFIAVSLLILASGARFVPETAVLDAVARMADSLAFHLLAIVCGFAGVLWLLRVRIVAVMLVAAAIASAAWMVRDVRMHSAPWAEASGAPLTLIFFNVLAEGADRAPQVADTLIAADADVIIVSEASLLFREMDRLRDHFAVISGCDDWPTCEVLILSRRSDIAINRDRALSDFAPYRYAEISLTLNGQPLTIVAAHLLKPWFSGFSWSEHQRLNRFLSRIEGPVVVTGDFNTAPWSYPMLRLLERRDLHTAPWPVATWPAWTRGYGVPIDQMLVGGGAALVSVSPFGEGLGSNHRGLMATVVIAP